GQIRQVLFNLLRNAAEAMPDGGEIAVELGREGSEATIAVRDRGPGIPTEHLDRAFEPFFTTKAGGTGLGLPTVHRIVTDHGGTGTIAPPPGRGTTLTGRLPGAGAWSGWRATPPPPPPARRGRPTRSRGPRSARAGNSPARSPAPPSCATPGRGRNIAPPRAAAAPPPRAGSTRPPAPRSRRRGARARAAPLRACGGTRAR